MESTQSEAVPIVVTATDESTVPASEQSSEKLITPDEIITNAHSTAAAVTAADEVINNVSTSESIVSKPLEEAKQSQTDAEMLPIAATTAVIIEHKETELEATTVNEVTTSESANAGALGLTLDNIEVMASEPTTQAMDVETETNHTATTDSTPVKTSGLSLLAAYDSSPDSDTENDEKFSDSDNENETRSVVEVPVAENSQYRKQVIAVSSGTESDDSSTDSDSEGEYLTVLRKKIEKKINTEDCDEDDEDFDDDVDDDGGRPRHCQPPKVRGELLLSDLPPIQQLEITVPEDECVELGKVQSIVDQLVLVSVLPNSMLFDLDTVLFLDKGRKVLGVVFDVLGQVADPLYCVRFNSNKQIQEQGINIGDIVYCAPKTEHTQFVILSKLMQMRGSDASWEHDLEPPLHYIDYSDDEAEREARLKLRKKRQRERTHATDTLATSNASTAAAQSTAPRQRGRRAAREFRQNGNHHMPQHDKRSRSHSRDSQYNYHPSYNPGSWHSNYYHNYHQPASNFNMPLPGMHFPVPNYGYGMPPHPYAMPLPMMPMYPPYGHPPPPPPAPPGAGC